jgi:hypothetical protein
MKARLMLIVFVGALVSACSWGPGALDETRDQILTVARKGETANFSKYHSFAISDSITVSEDGKKFRLSNDTTDMIIAQIVVNMNKYGYTQVVPTGNPDLLVDVSYIKKTNTYMYPGYWNDWDWWWDSFDYPWHSWDTFYPYPMPNFISSYTTGSLVIEVADVVSVATESSVPIVWHGLIREILNGTHTQQELISSIDEVFAILPPTNSK